MTLYNILACVTKQKTCERLIKKASEQIHNESSQLYILHVVKNNLNFLDNPKEGEALEYLFGISKLVGADLTVLRADNIIKTIAEFAIENNISQIFIGKSPDKYNENTFNAEISKLLPNIDIIVIP